MTEVVDIEKAIRSYLSSNINLLQIVNKNYTLLQKRV